MRRRRVAIATPMTANSAADAGSGTAGAASLNPNVWPYRTAGLGGRQAPLPQYRSAPPAGPDHRPAAQVVEVVKAPSTVNVMLNPLPPSETFEKTTSWKLLSLNVRTVLNASPVLVFSRKNS